MRILLAFLYFLSLIPSPDFGTTLCISGNEPIFEGLHFSADTQSCCDDDCCSLADHHDHTTCIDVDIKPLAVKCSISIPVSTQTQTISFESIFASTPFRAPPFAGKSHELPARIGLKLKSTAVIIC